MLLSCLQNISRVYQHKKKLLRKIFSKQIVIGGLSTLPVVVIYLKENYKGYPFPFTWQEWNRGEQKEGIKGCCVVRQGIIYGYAV